MADSSTVLREYLVRLGFKVDQVQAKRFDDGLAQWDKRATVLARSLAGVAVAAVGAVATFAYSMEKLYFASKRTDSAVGSIQALEYGASRVGVSGNSIRQSLEAMSRNMRANPGLKGLLESLGVPVTGRDMSDVMTDLVTQLNQMPFYKAQRFASLFGIDPDQLFQLEQGLEEFKRAQEERKRLAAELGVDSDKAAKDAHELANAWREVAMVTGLFSDKVLSEALPALLRMADVVKATLADWTKLVGSEGHKFDPNNPWDLKKNGSATPSDEEMKKDFAKHAKGGSVEFSPETRKRLGMPSDESNASDAAGSVQERWLKKRYRDFMRWSGAKGYQSQNGDQASVDAAQDDSVFKRGGYAPDGRGGLVRQPGKGIGTDEQHALIRKIEQQYALPEGVLQRTWAAESGEGANLTGPMTKSGQVAKGHFQFTDATGKEYGLDKEGGRADRDDFAKSSDAAGRMWADLLKRYKGDVRAAAGAYNWGAGNIDAWLRTGRGAKGQAMPSETQSYMNMVGGPALGAGAGGDATAASQGTQINQTNHITVSGVSDPQKVVALTKEQMDQNNADIVRNLNNQGIN